MEWHLLKLPFFQISNLKKILKGILDYNQEVRKHFQFIFFIKYMSAVHPMYGLYLFLYLSLQKVIEILIVT